MSVMYTIYDSIYHIITMHNFTQSVILKLKKLEITGNYKFMILLYHNFTQHVIQKVNKLVLTVKQKMKNSKTIKIL